MSTKTSIKRIAAVAAVALTLGGFSAVSAHATAYPTPNSIIYGWTGDGTTSGNLGSTYSFGSGLGSPTLNGVAGPVNTVVVQVAAYAGSVTAGTAYTTTSSETKRSIVSVSGAGSSIVSSLAHTGGAATGTVNTLGTQATYAANNAVTDLTIATPTAGTVVVKVYQESATSGIFSSTAAETVTITVAAAASSGTLSVANSSFYDTTTDAAATASLTTEPTVAKTLAATNAGFAARYDWSIKDSLTAAMPTTTGVTATIAGPGFLSTSATLVGANNRVLVLTGAASGHFYVYPDGASGVATVTLSAGSTVIGTHTVTFSSTTVASVKLTAIQTNVAVAAVTGYRAYTAADEATTATGTFYATAADSNGYAIASPVLTATSSDNTVATVAAGSYNITDAVTYFTVTGVAAGKATITVADTATGLVTATIPVTVSKAVATTVALTLDAASYNAGDKVTWTITAKDSNGSPIADGVYTSAAAAGFLTAAGLASNQSLPNGATPASGNLSFTGGVATGTFYAPANDFKLVGTTGTAATLVTAAQGIALSASATVASASAAAAQAAVDAANEATDAANAATDAANNAMDSADAAQQAALDAGDKADAALAAVTDLATKVSAIATQIAALSALVKKIAAKVKA
jgi:hypothetical protein